LASILLHKMIGGNNKKKQGNTALIIIILLFFTVTASVFIYLKFFSSNKKPSGEKPVFTYKKGDINRDEKVDQLDFMYIRNADGCRQTDSCWNKVVGKTSDGDNPIYVSVLDLNKDGVINKKDLDLAQRSK